MIGAEMGNNHPSQLLRLHQSISPGPKLTLWLFHKLKRFYGDELLAPRPTPKLEDHPLSAIASSIYIRSYPPYWRTFLHSQPKGARCRGDRDPFIRHSADRNIVGKSGRNITTANNSEATS